MLLTYLITSFLYLVIVGLDITIFFFAVRNIKFRWPWKWVASFDSVGRPIVDGIVEVLDQRAVPLGIGFIVFQMPRCKTRRRYARALGPETKRQDQAIHANGR